MAHVESRMTHVQIFSNMFTNMFHSHQEAKLNMFNIYERVQENLNMYNLIFYWERIMFGKMFKHTFVNMFAVKFHPRIDL